MTASTQCKAGRPKGSRQVMPTAAERRDYIRKLREQADAGDPTAIAALLGLEARP